MRAEGSTKISVSIPRELVEAIDAIAFKEERNRSNMITVLLRRAVSSSMPEGQGVVCLASGCGRKSEKAS
jgi:metal-responsive CopG/Arc/MetJ family transcriptional regulator